MVSNLDSKRAEICAPQALNYVPSRSSTLAVQVEEWLRGAGYFRYGMRTFETKDNAGNKQHT